MAGWIKVHRKILQSDFYQDLTGRQRDVIITLLLMADHEPREWKYKGITYKTLPGQVFTSIEKIRKNCAKDCTRDVVYQSILKAEQTGFLNRVPCSTHTLITIENWELYQDVKTEFKQDTNTLKTKQTCLLHPNKKKEERNNIYSQNSDEFRLAHLLFSLMTDNNPKVKEPNWNRWYEDINKIIRLDKRDIGDIENIIRFSQKDSFWATNILSPSKLRKQFDRLTLQAPKIKKAAAVNVDRKVESDEWSYI